VASGVRISAAIRWRDLDLLGHLNQSVYHELLEEARGELYERLSDGPMTAFVLARIELDYHREVRREDGPVEVVARVAAVGRSSVTLEHELRRADGELAATGKAVLVAFDSEARRSRELTEEERRWLEAARGEAAQRTSS